MANKEITVELEDSEIQMLNAGIVVKCVTKLGTMHIRPVVEREK